jgi:hypothetical protein
LNNNGNITISGSAFGSDARILTNTGDVTIIGSSFGLEDVEVSGNGGTVTMRNNKDFGAKITENGVVCFYDNSGNTSNVEFTKNGCLLQDRNDFESIIFDGNGDPCPNHCP